MKTKPAPAPPPRLPRFLAVLLALSLAANLALALFAWRSRSVPARPAAEAPAGEGQAPPRELLPYAALGSYTAENNRIRDLKWSEAQFQAFVHGLRASYEGRGYPLDEDARQLRDAISERVRAMLAREQPDAVSEYFRVLREREHVQATPSGLHFRHTLEGNGRQPAAGDTVVISFGARTPDGRPLPELTRARVTVRVGDLLPGLAEGVRLLKVGGKALVYVPPSLSFGGGEWPAGVARGAPIVFFLELHEIAGGAAAPP